MGLFKCASQGSGKTANTLVIDGGDISAGLTAGPPICVTIHWAMPGRFAEMMNRCGYDYVTLGNHDFNYGAWRICDSYLDTLRDPPAFAKTYRMGPGRAFASPARIHTLENGLRIGIVGIVTDYVNIWERPEHLSGVTIR